MARALVGQVSGVQDILFGVTGQSLVFDAPEGRPSSVVSSTVFENSTGDDGTAEVATTGSAAVETSPNTTFDAASGDGQADARVCNILATTGVAVGRTFLAASATGERDWVEVESFISGVSGSVTARQPLKNAYTTADAFVSTRITHAIDSTWVADKANLSGAFDANPRYRWRLVYVVGGVTYAIDRYFDLLRYAGRHDVTPLDVDRRMRGWLDRLASEDREDQGRAVIDEAYQVVKFDLYNLSLPDQAIRNRELLNELVTLQAIAMVDATDVTEKKYADRLSQFIAFGKASVSEDESGAAGPLDIRPIWRR
jgi:hypothetical protein